MSDLKIRVILGSTREGRYGDKPAHWILGKLAGRDGVDAQLLDLRDYSLPIFDRPRPPVRVTDGDYGHPIAQAWARQIADADGYVMTAAEYNHGYAAVLKNSLDWIYREWNRKPISFVGYGSVGGARAVEQLRQVAVELELAPLRHAVHLPREILLATMKLVAPIDPAAFASVDAAADAMIDDLLWWARALRRARDEPVGV